MDHVDDTLKQWRQGSHVWGESDCLLSVGDYLHQLGYADVSSKYRGTYNTEEGANAHKKDAGGPDALIDMTGAPRSDDEPKRGDVVLIHGVGAICTGDGYALRLDRGVVEVPRRFCSPTVVWRP